MNDRIKLAEAMGKAIKWRNGVPFRPGSIIEFDPESDANDCEALIAYLAGDLLTITVTFGKGVLFDHYSGTKQEWEGPNWKQGVCELALKVIE